MASRAGKLDAVKLLINAGASLELASFDHATPLYVAAGNSKLEMK